MAADLDDPFDPAFGADLTEVPMAELRRRRSVADEVETGRSYLRRLVQGRLDIVLAERHRRDAGEAAGDTSDLVAHLPSILGDHVHAPGLGRLPSLMTPGEIDPKLQGRLDAIVPSHTLANLPEVPDAELSALLDGLTDFERHVSQERRVLHEVLDALQHEMVRRYRDKEASVDDLLNPAPEVSVSGGVEVAVGDEAGRGPGSEQDRPS